MLARLRIEDRDRGRWLFHDDEGSEAPESASDPASGPRVVVLLGGGPPPEERLRDEASRARALVCANGGYKAAVAAGLSPDLVVGDLDSLPAWARDKLPEGAVHRDPRPDDNDLEKAVREVFRRWGAGAELSLLGAGADRDRSDHAIANLGVLIAEPHRRIQWVDGAGRMIALRHGKLVIEDAVGATLSVLPWSLHGTVVSEIGLHYPLDEERLHLGGRGVSNEIGDETAWVEVHEGVALVWIGV
jgi:thiamine pyrophosphokinase